MAIASSPLLTIPLSHTFPPRRKRNPRIPAMRLVHTSLRSPLLLPPFDPPRGQNSGLARGGEDLSEFCTNPNTHTFSSGEKVVDWEGNGLTSVSGGITVGGMIKGTVCEFTLCEGVRITGPVETRPWREQLRGEVRPVPTLPRVRWMERPLAEGISKESTT